MKKTIIILFTLIVCSGLYAQNRTWYSSSGTRSGNYWQADIRVSMAFWSHKGMFNGIGFERKILIYEDWLRFDFGLSVEFNHLLHSVNDDEILVKNKSVVAGVPLLLELSRPNNHRPSVYFSIGVVPVFYNSSDLVENGTPIGSQSGIMLALPRMDLGAYFPVGGDKYIRFGLIYQRYFSTDDDNLFKRTAKSYAGVSLGFVF